MINIIRKPGTRLGITNRRATDPAPVKDGYHLPVGVYQAQPYRVAVEYRNGINPGVVEVINPRCELNADELAEVMEG